MPLVPERCNRPLGPDSPESFLRLSIPKGPIVLDGPFVLHGPVVPLRPFGLIVPYSPFSPNVPHGACLPLGRLSVQSVQLSRSFYGPSNEGSAQRGLPGPSGGCLPSTHLRMAGGLSQLLSVTLSTYPKGSGRPTWRPSSGASCVSKFYPRGGFK